MTFPGSSSVPMGPLVVGWYQTGVPCSSSTMA